MDFFNDIFHNLALLEFYFLNIILHFTLHRLYIVNIFPTFKHFNPSFSPLMPRIKYRTCLDQWISALQDDHKEHHENPIIIKVTLNERVNDTNQQLECLFNSLFRLTSRKHQSPASLTLCEGNPVVTGGFRSQMVSKSESVSMSWCCLVVLKTSIISVNKIVLLLSGFSSVVSSPC